MPASSWANDKLTKAAAELERLDALASAPVAPAPQPPDALPACWVVVKDGQIVGTHDAPCSLYGIQAVRYTPEAAPVAPAPQPADAEAWDAELGRVAMRFVDRAGDVHPGIDDAERICAGVLCSNDRSD